MSKEEACTSCRTWLVVTDFGIHSEGDRKSLEGSEQRMDVV